jgi:hypothetical protein
MWETQFSFDHRPEMTGARSCGSVSGVEGTPLQIIPSTRNAFGNEGASSSSREV